MTLTTARHVIETRMWAVFQDVTGCLILQTSDNYDVGLWEEGFFPNYSLPIRVLAQYLKGSGCGPPREVPPAAGSRLPQP